MQKAEIGIIGGSGLYTMPGLSDVHEEKLETPFIVGESVKVMDGPFNGFTGSVEEVFEERKKLNVMVKIFGRNTPVELNYMQVEKMQ